MNSLLNDLNTYLMVVLTLLMLGDTVAGTIDALKTHRLKSAISKQALLNRLKIYIGLLTVWLGVEVMSFAVNANELKAAMTSFVLIAIVNELNSLLELMGSPYTKAEKKLIDSFKNESEDKK